MAFDKSRYSASKGRLRKGRSSAFFCTSTTPQERRNVVFIDIVAPSFTVGYAQSGLKQGATMLTPQFLGIGSNTALDLQSIKPQGEDTSDNISIQTLDAYGRMVDNYIWCNWAGESGDQEAWSDGSGDIIEGVSFPAGQGLWVQGSASGQYLRFPAPEL